MATLVGQKISATYKDLLQVSNSNAGIDGTVRTVSDGEATPSVLGLSTAYVTCGTIRFNASGTIDTTSGSITFGATTVLSSATTISGALTLSGSSFTVSNAATFRTSFSGAASGANTDITSVLINRGGLVTRSAGAGNLAIACQPSIASDATFYIYPTSGGTNYIEYLNSFSGLSLGGGAYTGTFTFSGNTSVTFPTSGTLATTSQLTSGTVTSVSGAGLATGTVTTSGSITVTAATQSDQETGTSTTTAVTPGRQHYHLSAAKAWINFTSITTTASNQSYNVTSVTDNGTGDTTVTFTTAFSAATYGVVACSMDNGSGVGMAAAIKQSGVSTGSCRVITFTPSTLALADSNNSCFAFFGDQ